MSCEHTYQDIAYAKSIKYKYLNMYKLYNEGKQTITPWEYINETKSEYIILYFNDIRQQYDNRLKYTRDKIIKRSNSF